MGGLISYQIILSHKKDGNSLTSDVICKYTILQIIISLRVKCNTFHCLHAQCTFITKSIYDTEIQHKRWTYSPRYRVAW